MQCSENAWPVHLWRRCKWDDAASTGISSITLPQYSLAVNSDTVSIPSCKLDVSVPHCNPSTMPLIATNPKPRVILGLMTFGPDASEGARTTSLTEYNAFLDHFQAAGYNEVDTARTYVGGKQEAFTRDAKWKERGLTLATKIWPNTPGSHGAQALTEAFNSSLKELGSDSVDIFYLHAPVGLPASFKNQRLTNVPGSLGAFCRNLGGHR